MFKRAKFLLSASAKEHFPTAQTEGEKHLAEVALIGRSNVGKSSLLNHLAQNRQLAHTSSKPGKTRQINFFQGEGLLIADLPGYGFANVAKKMRSSWADLIEQYLSHRKQLKLILHLIDARHLPTKDDLLFATWGHHFGCPILTIFTKGDKLNASALNRQCQKNDALLREVGHRPSGYMCYSIKDAKARICLTKEIEQRIRWD